MTGLRLAGSAVLDAGGCVRFSAGGEGVFRVTIGRGASPRPVASYAVVGEGEFDPAGVEVECAAAHWVARSGGFRASVGCGANAGAFSLSLGGQGIPSVESAGNALEFEGQAIRLRLAIGGGTQWFGLGGFGETLARVPGRYDCWNSDDPFHQPLKAPYCAIPFAIVMDETAGGAVGVFVDNPGRVVFDLGMKEPGTALVETATGDLDLWLIAGCTPGAVIGKWTRLTGRMERPPMWSLGFHQSRWSYMNAEEVRSVAAGFRSRGIPCDVLHLDIDYMDGYRVFTWDGDRFPQPRRLMDDLANDGFQAITIVDPGVKIDPAYAVYTSGLGKNLFLRHANGSPVTAKVWPGETHHPDFTNPAVRSWWAEAHKPLFDAGVRGIWCDMNEPAVWGDSLRCHDYPPDAVHHDEGNFRSHREVHNVYGLCMARSARMALERERPDERPFVLTRSGWAGMQRHTAVWTGDNRSCYGSMPLDLVQVLSFGVCGVAHAGCDIGGFQNDGHGDLFLRWMEWGIFQPFCRAHSAWGTARQEPWSFGPEVEDGVRSLLSLRMTLLPYLYTLFVEASRTGMPVVRPMFVSYPQDLTARRIGDQFLLGGDLLVAPVMEAGRDRRMVYFPEGEWIAHLDGTRYAGGQWIIAPTPAGTAPLFWRAGSAVPVEFNPRQHTGEAVAEAGFRVHAASEIRGAWVMDDGISRRFREGEESILSVDGAETDGGAWLNVTAERLGYELPCKALGLEFLASRPVRAWSVSGKVSELPRPSATVKIALPRIPSGGVRVEFHYA